MFDQGGNRERPSESGLRGQGLILSYGPPGGQGREIPVCSLNLGFLLHKLDSPASSEHTFLRSGGFFLTGAQGSCSRSLARSQEKRGWRAARPASLLAPAQHPCARLMIVPRPGRPPWAPEGRAVLPALGLRGCASSGPVTRDSLAVWLFCGLHRAACRLSSGFACHPLQWRRLLSSIHQEQ